LREPWMYLKPVAPMLTAPRRRKKRVTLLTIVISERAGVEKNLDSSV